MLKREEFLGFNFCVSNDIKDTAQEIMNSIPTNSLNDIPIILTLNVDYVVKLNRPENKDLIDRLRKSKFIFADGQPIVWASKFYKKNIKHRITGSDLFPEMYEIAKEQNIQILLISPGKDTSDYYRKDYPSACIYELPFVDRNDTSAFDTIIKHCVDLIMQNQIRAVFIGVSFPKQDKIALGIYDALTMKKYTKIPLLGLLGASLEFTAGVKKRAPAIYQELGMEWFYRFIKEPRRLFSRYFIESFKFLSILNSFEHHPLQAEDTLADQLPKPLPRIVTPYIRPTQPAPVHEKNVLPYIEK